MPAQWTADLIGKMHLAGISSKQLAEAAGITPEYLSMILNGHREPQNAEQVLRDALSRILARNDEGGENMTDCIYPHGCDSARIMVVIETKSARGAGTNEHPSRMVTQYWTLDGKFLAEEDSLLEPGVP